MNILVVGCGKVGSELANLLCVRGHDVSVVDVDPENFSRLSNDFSGFTVTGVPIDMDVLRRGGIEGCDVVVAVTPSDNMNVMVTQMAKEMFGVSQVVTRIFDPRRREVFDRLGLHTVCQTALTVSALESVILGSEGQQISFGQSSTLSMESMDPPREMVGQPLSRLVLPSQQTVIGLLRHNGVMSMAGDEPHALISGDDRLVYARVID